MCKAQDHSSESQLKQSNNEAVIVIQLCKIKHYASSVLWWSQQLLGRSMQENGRRLSSMAENYCSSTVQHALSASVFLQPSRRGDAFHCSLTEVQCTATPQQCKGCTPLGYSLGIRKLQSSSSVINCKVFWMLPFADAAKSLLIWEQFAHKYPREPEGSWKA